MGGGVWVVCLWEGRGDVNCCICEWVWYCVGVRVFSATTVNFRFYCGICEFSGNGLGSMDCCVVLSLLVHVHVLGRYL